MRGVLAEVAVVLIIAMTIVAGVSIYYFVLTEEKHKNSALPEDILVNYVGGNRILIANIGSKPVNVSGIKASNKASIDCDKTMLEPKEQEVCLIKNTTIGTIAVYAPEVPPKILYVNTGDIDPPRLEEVVLHTPSPHVDDGVEVTANVSDNMHIGDVYLHYHPTKGGDFKTKMVQIGGTDKRGTWRGVFYPNADGDWIYYITAYDTSGNSVNSSTYTIHVDK